MKNRPPFIDLITRQLELWAEQRDKLQHQIDEIDRKVEAAAKSLDVDLSGASDASAPEADRLPIREDASRSKGTMAQFIRDFMASASKGYTRAELRAEVAAASEDFAARLNHNANPFYNTIKRMIGRELVDIQGVLYDAKRAPDLRDAVKRDDTLPFPSNVTPLKTATDQ